MSYNSYNKKPYNSYKNNNGHNNNNHRVAWKDNAEVLSPTNSETQEDKTNINIKNVVLDYLYNKIEVAEHRYILIKNIGDVYELKNSKYYVSGNSCGINSFLIFMKKDNNYYSYLVDRRSISYNRNALKKSTVRFTEIKLPVDLKLYEGTIIDGILIDNDNNKIVSKTDSNFSKMNFMITDIFTFCGKSILSMNYKHKMFTIETILTEYIKKNKSEPANIELFISRPYEINQTSDLFAEYIYPNIKLYNIKGLTYYPEYSGSKIIYLFDKQDEKIKNELVNRTITITPNAKTDDNLQLLEVSETKKIFKFELINPECIDDIVLNLEMKKTGISDVYKLYGIFFNGRKYIKKKIGIAYIPTYELSLKCKMHFLNHDSKIMNCKFNSYKGKWIPIDESSIQKIDIINNEKRIKITEEEFIEQDCAIDD